MKFKNPMYRNGDKCTVICTDKPGTWPVVTHDSDGVLYMHDINGSLYHSDKIISNWDLVDSSKPTYGHIDVDAEVIVTGECINPYPAHFAGIDVNGGRPRVFKDGRTSHTVKQVNLNETTITVDHVEVVS